MCVCVCVCVYVYVCMYVCVSIPYLVSPTMPFSLPRSNPGPGDDFRPFTIVSSRVPLPPPSTPDGDVIADMTPANAVATPLLPLPPIPAPPAPPDTMAGAVAVVGGACCVYSANNTPFDTAGGMPNCSHSPTADDADCWDNGPRPLSCVSSDADRDTVEYAGEPSVASGSASRLRHDGSAELVLTNDAAWCSGAAP